MRLKNITVGFLMILPFLSAYADRGDVSPEVSTNYIVNEDRYWIYNYTGGGPTGSPIKIDVLVKSFFSGVEEIDGKEYHVFHTEDISTKNETERIVIPEFYIREENGVVYVNCIHGYFEDPDREPADVQNNEYIAYDFNKGIGGSFAGAIIGSNMDRIDFPNYNPTMAYFDMEYTIVDIQDNADYGKTYIVKDENNTPSFKYLTGIGIVSPEPPKDHLSLNYIFLPLYGPHAVAISTTRAYWCHLVGVYDKEDNLIYAGRLDLGVEGLPGDDKLAGVQSPVYFNLQGQPVTNPEKGNLYIERTSASARKILF